MTDTMKNISETKKDKYGLITLIIIIGIIIISVISLALFLVDRKIKNDASIAFENAYDKITDFDNLPNIYSKQDMENQVIDLLNKVIIQYPNTPSGKRALFYKGHVLFYSNDFDKAEKVFKQFIHNNKNFYLTDKAYYYLSYCYSENNKIDDAVKVLEEFINNYKNSYYQPIAMYRIANLFELKNNKEEAIAFYQKIIDKYSSSSQKEPARLRLALLKNDVTL